MALVGAGPGDPELLTLCGPQEDSERSVGGCGLELEARMATCAQVRFVHAERAPTCFPVVLLPSRRALRRLEVSDLSGERAPTLDECMGRIQDSGTWGWQQKPAVQPVVTVVQE